MRCLVTSHNDLHHKKKRQHPTTLAENYFPMPEEERAEIRDIYREMGFEGTLLEQVTDQITANRDRWVKPHASARCWRPWCWEVRRLPWRTGWEISSRRLFNDLATLHFSNLIHLP